LEWTQTLEQIFYFGNNLGLIHSRYHFSDTHFPFMPILDYFAFFLRDRFSCTGTPAIANGAQKRKTQKQELRCSLLVKSLFKECRGLCPAHGTKCEGRQRSPTKDQQLHHCWWTSIQAFGVVTQGDTGKIRRWEGQWVERGEPD